MTGFEQFSAIVVGAVCVMFVGIAWAQAFAARGGGADAEPGDRHIDV